MPRVKSILLTLLLIVLSAIAAFHLWEYESTGFLEKSRKAISDAEIQYRATTAAQFRSLTESDRKSMVAIAVSASSLEQLLRAFEGAIWIERESGMHLTLIHVETQFETGFPKVGAIVRAESGGLAVDFKAWSALEYDITSDEVMLRLVFITIEPQVNMPKEFKTIASAETVRRMNAEMQPFKVPLTHIVTITPGVVPIEDFPVKTPNGQVWLHLDLPQPPPLSAQWQPVAVFFDRDGLHVLGWISATESIPPSSQLTSSDTSAPTDTELEALLAPWRLSAGSDYSARMPVQPVLDLLSRINGWTVDQRTVKVHGVREEGNLIERTGGLPFGNGFRAWLDGADRLQVRAVLANLRPVWTTGAGLFITGNVAATGTVQVNVHGNAPHIPPPRLFGHRIGGGVTLGGGAGSSVGATASGASDIKATLNYRSAAQDFCLQIVSPEHIHCKLAIGGVPPDLVKLFTDGFDIPLPVGKDLYRFDIPALLSKNVEISLPSTGSPIKKAFELAAPAPVVEFGADAINFRGPVQIAPK